MYTVLHKKHPGSNAAASSQPLKKRRESETEEYEKLLQKRREVQEAIDSMIKGNNQSRPGQDSSECGKRERRSRSRSGSQTSGKEKISSKEVRL